MSDYISRKAAEERLDRLEREAYHNSVLWPDHVEECREAIREIPAADVVEVVRCKDCKHYNPEATEWRCDIVAGLVEPYDDDFCSYGERRTASG